jgi:hypothetical protein
VLILVWVPDIAQIVRILSVLEDQWLLHLMRYVVLIVWRRWFETGWCCWVDLHVFAQGMIVLAGVVDVNEIVRIVSVLPVQRLLHLMWDIKLIVWRWGLKACGMSWVDLGK